MDQDSPGQGRGSVGLPDVSVIIPTYRSAEVVRPCLQSIERQQGVATEVILVDRPSGDGLAEVAEEHGAVVVRSDSGRTEARNLGLQGSRGAFVLSLDADMRLQEGLLLECLQRISGGQDALVIPEETRGTGFWAECRRAERDSYKGNPFVESPRFFRRDILYAIGGYDPGLLFGEDMDVTLRLRKAGYRIGRTSRSLVHDEGDLDLAGQLRKRYSYSLSAPRFVRKHGRQSVGVFGPGRVAGPQMKALLDQPALIVAGVAVMKMLEYGVSTVGYLQGSFRCTGGQGT